VYLSAVYPLVHGFLFCLFSSHAICLLPEIWGGNMYVVYAEFHTIRCSREKSRSTPSL
jgi:hypothetical protein